MDSERSRAINLVGGGSKRAVIRTTLDITTLDSPSINWTGPCKYLLRAAAIADQRIPPPFPLPSPRDDEKQRGEEGFSALEKKKIGIKPLVAEF